MLKTTAATPSRSPHAHPRPTAWSPWPAGRTGTAQTDELLAKLNVKDFTAAGSSLKFCLVAAAMADIYPRFGRTMEWDTAAGHAVLVAAGGTVRTIEGDDLLYGKDGFENPFFVARGLDN